MANYVNESFMGNHTDVYEDYSTLAILSRIWDNGRVRVPMYSVIFILAVVGNTLVILTLIQNKRMRTVTNMFLLSLAVSDLLLGVFCMPVTLVGTLLRNFIFGRIMCKILSYSQAVSVAVSSWSLVALSVERYYAICHPLRSRQWQTLSHAYKIIILIWCISFVLMVPIPIQSQLILYKDPDHYKCREDWGSDAARICFTFYLMVGLLVLPGFILIVTYVLITSTLWAGIRDATNPAADASQGTEEETLENGGSVNPQLVVSCLRHSNQERTIRNKIRVIKMLCVVVVEFFVCWSPLYIMDLISAFDSDLVYPAIGYSGVNFIQLLAYASSCCNPITYCFMNQNFRKAFKNLFCCKGMDNALRPTFSSVIRGQRNQRGGSEMELQQFRRNNYA